MVLEKKKLWLYVGIGGAALAVLITGILLLVLLLPARPGPAATAPTTLPLPEQSVFTPDDFAYDGPYLTCLTQESILGIDVSTHQKEIDWQQVRQAGITFVMIRAGYRGSEQGLLFEDEWAQRNYWGAKTAGLKVGAYFFSQAVTPEEALEEARFAMEIIEGWQLDMPLVYDWEYISDDSRTAAVDARSLTDCTRAFCDEVSAAGYRAMVYFNPEQSRKLLYLEELTDYAFWLAMYDSDMTYEYKVDMWQYTCRGTVPGIVGDVDINLYFPYYYEKQAKQ